MTKKYAYLMKGIPQKIGSGKFVILTEGEIKKGRERVKKAWKRLKKKGK